MRRFVGLFVVLLFAMPFGLSVTGCGHKQAVQYCPGNNLESGPTAGQVKTITLASNLTVSGESLNYGQIGQQLSASAEDCFNSPVTISRYTFSTSDTSVADINPATGSVCAGTWNRNTGGGIADFTLCTPPAAATSKHTAFVYAQGNGATSNAIAVYIHAPVTGVSLGIPSANCDTDPASNCATSNGLTCNPNTIGSTVTAPPYDGNSCLSQTQTGQLTARVYAGGIIDAAHNITCQVGPVNFALQGTTNIATISAQGFATANQPGSALITATVSNSSSALNSGFISTCPPASITLSAVNQPAGASSIAVGLNTPQNFTASVLDTRGNPITGLSLEFNSTLPVNFPASGGSVVPVFPGSATITAVCNPPTCNAAPFSQIGFLGNGKPITSNGITVTAAGTSASVLYMASTPSTTTVDGNTVTNAGSQYIVSEDFTTGQLSSPIKLPYVPNSMVISQDGTTLYLGSTQGLMTVTTASNAFAANYPTVQGTVLAVAPNNSYIVVSDPNRQTVSLINPNGSVASTFNGIGTRASWTPDSNTLYVLATAPGQTDPNQLLTYSSFTGWNSTGLDQAYSDLAITVPAVGAYFAGQNITEGRSYCANTSLSAGVPPTATNAFYPVADQKAITTDRLAATTDGMHILGASVTGSAIQDLAVTFPTTTVNGRSVIAACPQPPKVISPGYFGSTVSTHPLTGVNLAAITGVVPATNSGTAFVTYTGTGGVLPIYQPATGAVTNITLSSGATAPVAGVYSSDNTTFYAGTSGDKQVHVITVNGAASKDTGVIAPNLQDPNGGIATPNLIVQRVRRTTS